MDMQINMSSVPASTVLSSTEGTHNVEAPNFFVENYIIVGTCGLLLVVIFIAILVLLIRRIRDRCCFNKKLLETYSSINYDDEFVDNELDENDDLIYTSCKLFVGNELGLDSDATNSEPEYDTMSVDVSVSANASAIVDWNSKEKNHEMAKPEEMSQSLKTLPHTFWKR